jgi:hypothetical protein
MNVLKTIHDSAETDSLDSSKAYIEICPQRELEFAGYADTD